MVDHGLSVRNKKQNITKYKKKKIEREVRLLKICKIEEEE
jgi:hypothetical protein